MFADRKTRAVLPHGVDADSELRQTRAECDHGEADHDGSHAEVRGERGAAANQQFRPNEQPRKPGHDEQGARHGLMLRASCAAAVAASDDRDGGSAYSGVARRNPLPRYVCPGLPGPPNAVGTSALDGPGRRGRRDGDRSRTTPDTGPADRGGDAAGPARAAAARGALKLPGVSGAPRPRSTGLG
jgi:hypothetical protein